jgi:YD repeat-containing protein
MQRLLTKEFIFSIYTLLCFQTQIFSQNYNTAPNFNPVPPSSFQFIKYGEIPVSEYTGIPTISIPVYTIKDGDIEFPINLSYHAGGIRVAEEASWVGLGWNLDLGNITQIVNDRDDLGAFEKKLLEYYGSGDPTTKEFTYKYNYPILTNLAPSNIPSTGITKEAPFHSFVVFTDYYAPLSGTSGNYCCQIPSIFNGQGINHDRVDSEPDVFKASFNGHYLEFIFNLNTNNIVVLNKKNYIVSFTRNQVGTAQWSITCPDGMLYQFNQVDEVKLDFSAASSGVSERSQSYERDVVNRVWHLTKIVSPNNRQINFEWETTGLVKDLPSYSNTDFYSKPIGVNRMFVCGWAEDPQIQGTVFQKLNGELSIGQPITEAMLHGISYSRLQNSAKSYISSITFSMGSIKFKKSLRKDRVNDLRLDSIIVKSPARMIKKLNFDYDYFVATEDGFSADKTVSNELQNPTSGVFPSQYHPNFGQLFSDFQSNELRFRLKLVSVGEEGLPGHRFKYDNGKLPKKTSYATDYWGFYNGKTTNTSFVPNPIHLDVLLADNGNDKRASLPFARACTINEIIYPTGGVTKLEYELNRFVMYKFDNSVSPEYQNAISPISEGMGLRVGFSVDEAEGRVTTKRKYTYEGGRVILPIKFNNSYKKYLLNWSPQAGDVYSFDLEFLSGTNSYASSMLGSGNFIGYDKVIKESLDAQGISNGRTETSFYNNPDIIAFERYANMALPARKNPLFPDNGLVKKVDIFNSSGQSVSSTINQYIYQISDPYYGIKTMEIGGLFYVQKLDGVCDVIKWPQNLAGYYPLYSGESLLQWSEKREFGEGVPLTIRTNFSYFSDNTLTSSFSQNSNGENSSIFYQYPKNNIDLPPNIANALLARNIVSETISERNFKGGSLVLEKKKNFDFFNSLIKVKSIVEQVGANLPEEKIIFDRYDEFGNPLSYHKPNDVTHSYIWGCYNSFPVAEVKNAQVEQIAFADFEESSNQGGWTYVISQNQGKSGRFGFSGNSISKTIPLGNYEIRFWAKRLNSLNGSVSGSVSLSVVSDEWQYFSFKTNSTSSISLNLSNVVLDDVALFPVGAQLTSFCHDPLIGLISLTDPNGMITNFKYDKNGRLTSVIDHAGNIVKGYKYGYKIN